MTYLLRWSDAAKRIPATSKRTITQLFGTGALLFGFGFFIWNMDNIFCDFLIVKKLSIGWPFAFLLEGGSNLSALFSKVDSSVGHSWWHVFTVR
jgi:dihydroceramidase